MTSRRRHLLAAVGFAALSAIWFGLLIWAFVEGAVVVFFPSDAKVMNGKSMHYDYWNRNIPYTREENPGIYWGTAGVMCVCGTLFAVVAALERRSYLNAKGARKSKDPTSPTLLAQIDQACQRYPEGREALLRAKTALLELNSPELEAALDNLLQNILRAPDREAALKEIEGLMKAMHLFAKL